jgi:hypothetical protein
LIDGVAPRRAAGNAGLRPRSAAIKMSVRLLCFGLGMALTLFVSNLNVSYCQNTSGPISSWSDFWAAAGLEDVIARATDDIFPDAVLDQLVKESKLFRIYDQAERQKNYLNAGSGISLWMPLYDQDGKPSKPRNAIEAAIRLIYESDFSDSAGSHLQGAEWLSM